MAKINQNQWCFSWRQPVLIAGKPRAVVLTDTRWDCGETITISFTDGPKKLQNKVWDAAQEWIGADMANLTFALRKNGVIRISFEQRGSWSSIGTTCRNVPAGKPTMNFGWLKETSSPIEIQRVVLHEFGHALGLVHEHQSPAGGIKWNRAQVEADVSGAPQFWTKQQMENNIFKPFAKSMTRATKLDPKSIMLYPIPRRWTTGFSSSTNTSISAMDRDFIRKIYPH